MVSVSKALVSLTSLVNSCFTGLFHYTAWLDDMQSSCWVAQWPQVVLLVCNQMQIYVGGRGKPQPCPSHWYFGYRLTALFNKLKASAVSIQLQKGVFCGLQNTLKCITPLGELTTLPRLPSWPHTSPSAPGFFHFRCSLLIASQIFSSRTKPVCGYKNYIMYDNKDVCTANS